MKQLTKENILEVIEDWQSYWMFQTQNNQDDYLNYRHRAFGIDANMRHSLAQQLVKVFVDGVDKSPKEDEKCSNCQSTKFVVARDMKATRHCTRCMHTWLPGRRNE